MTKDERITEAMLIEAVASEHDVDKSKISIKDWTTSTGAGVTDGFACEMLAIHGEAVVDGKDEAFDYMSKVDPVSVARQQMLKVMEFGLKECEMYGNMLPEFNKMRSEAGLEPLRSPKCYFSNPTPNILIMENLKAKNYVMRKSIEDGLTDSEVEIFCEELAAFHASAYHFIKTKFGDNGEFVKKHPMMAFFKMIIPETEEMIKSTLMGGAGNIDILARDYMDPGVADRFAKFIPQVWDMFKDGLAKPCGSFNTLIHGDSWANNAMFKHDDNGKANGFVLFDYQCCRITTPGQDLGYLLITGTSAEARETKLEKWLKLYHDKFSADLAKFGHDANEVFSFDTLLKDYNEAYKINFAWAIQHSQVLLMNDTVKVKLVDFKTAETPEAQFKALEELKVLMKEAIATCQQFRERATGLVKEGMAKNLF